MGGILAALLTAVPALAESNHAFHKHTVLTPPADTADAAGPVTRSLRVAAQPPATTATSQAASTPAWVLQLANLLRSMGMSAAADALLRAPPPAPGPTPVATGPAVKLRVLVLAADGNEADLPAITQGLDYVGTPYDVWIAAQKPGMLTAAALATGSVGNYAAVMLTDAALGYYDGTSWGSALTAAEWTALYAYEAQYKVRHLNWYAWPTPDLGFAGSPTAMDTTGNPLSWTLTAAAKPMFTYLNGTAPIVNAYTYLAQADASATPLILDGQGHALAVMKTFSDGREMLTMTFDSAPWLQHAQILSYGLMDWATKGVFVGNRAEFLAAQIDDFFLDSDIYTGGTYRITGADLTGVDDWQRGWASTPLLPGFKLDLYFNGEGSLKTEWDFTDTLTPKARSLQGHFKWGSHTYTHQNLDATDYATTKTELSKNNQVAVNFGFTNYFKGNLVQPEVSGLTNATALQAMADFGIKYVVADTSKPGQSAPANLGIYNALQPGILEIPRFPTNLYYNVSTPTEWVTEYNAIYRSYWGRDLAYAEILDKESDMMLGYLLKGEMNPLMFHQANLRMYDGAHSLLGDLVDRTLSKYGALYNLPIASLSMDQLGVKFAQRMAMAASGVDATLTPGVSVTLKVNSAADVVLTGVCSGTVVRYGGECVRTVTVKPGTAVTVPLK